MAEIATKPSPKATAVDVALTLEDREMPLAELIKATSQIAVASAWACGDVEVGRRVRVVTGNPKITITREGESKSALVVEDGIEWTGPKTSRHTSLAEMIAASELPTAERYRKYEKAKNDQGDEYLKPVAISREEAVKLCAYTVRLTDKGLATLQPA